MEGAEPSPETHDVSGASSRWRGEDERDPFVLASDLTALASIHARNAEALSAETDKKLEFLLKECAQLDLECEKIFEQAHAQEELPKESSRQEAMESAPKQTPTTSRKLDKGTEPARFVPKVTRIAPKPTRLLPKPK
ncbi:hypothetical protein, conserved [Eimeria praecox]|uniref:Uncharacterized protein n=1 Tax=Eimeria praecox TaxID=51316 RepID=U6GR13_9EIME|nr:hypothetical protein, conserved [Eimeria praecox]